VKDPFLPQILGLLCAGLTATAFSVSGYLNQAETVRFLGATLTYQAAYRKIPCAMAGTGLCISAWLLTQSRREYRQQVKAWEQQAAATQNQVQAIHQQAEMQSLQQIALLRAAEKYYPEMQAYLDDDYADYTPVPAEQAAESQTQQPGAVPPQPRQQATATAAPGASSDLAADTTAYLQNFLEYPGLVFGGQGSGKSWTARYLVAQKVRAGHQVVVLDPHAAAHEWKGVRSVGAGMDYKAIAEFLEDEYLGEIERRYKEFNQSGLSEEDWQQSLRRQGRITSVACEEMTNWADRLPGDIASRFLKSAMTDSRKALMPPLFVSHDRTLTSIGDAKGIAKLRDVALLELELIPAVHPTTRKPVSSGQGKLKLPGHGEWLPVELPRCDRKITDFSVYQQPKQEPSQPQQSNTSTRQPQPDFRAQVVHFLKDCWQQDEEDNSLDALPDGNLKSLAVYLKKKEEIAVRAVRQNWGSSHSLNGEQVSELLIQLIEMNLIETYTPANSRAEWVRWLKT
jgi:hypothetical protein